MKKILLIAGVFVLSTCTACSNQNNSINNDKDNLETVNISSENDVTESDSEGINFDAELPSWLENYSVLDKTVYIAGQAEKFEVKDGKYCLPESNIVACQSRIGEQQITDITNRNEDLQNLFAKLQNEQIVDTLPQVDEFLWYDMSLCVVLLTTDGNYNKVTFTFREDGVVMVNQIDNKDQEIEYFYQSDDLCSLLKSIIGYKEIDVLTYNNITKIRVADLSNNEYILSDDEIINIKNILSGLSERIGCCGGPYDIRIYCDEESENPIYIEWCNDECNLITVNGKSYKVDDENGKWIVELLSSHGFN